VLVRQEDPDRCRYPRLFPCIRHCPHERLLGKLDHYGIRGKIQEWIRSFLCSRQMWVAVDGETSQKCKVDSGLPQGTVLGPLLFLLFINDLPDQVSPGTITRLFADDCLAYREIKSEGDQRTFQRDLEELSTWASKWGMRFNPFKCNIMRIHTGNSQYPNCTSCVAQFSKRSIMQSSLPRCHHQQ